MFVCIICHLVWPETKEYRGVPSLAYMYAPCQHGVFNRIGSATCSCQLVYEKKFANVCN